MRKEVTVFLICTLILFADAVSGWHMFEFWQNGELDIPNLYLLAIIGALLFGGLIFSWSGIVLAGRIYEKGLFY